MDYFSLKDGHLLTIMMPLTFIIGKILMFLKLYVNNAKVTKIFNCLTLIFGVVSTIIFYLRGWGNYFCFTWIINSVGSIIMFNYIDRGKYLGGDGINILELIIIIFSSALGIFMIVLPYTRIFEFIGGGYYRHIDTLSKILFTTYGICLILLDKHTECFFRKLKEKS